MTRCVLILGTLVLSLTVFGQGKKIGFALQISNPSKDDINVGWFNIDGESIDGYNLKEASFAGGILATYVLNEETSLRLRMGMSRYWIEEYRDHYYEDGVHEILSNKGIQNKMHLAPGVIWKISKNKFEAFGGFEVPINIHGEFTMDYNSKATNNGVIVVNDKILTTLPSGYSFGIGALMGFNFTPSKRFSLGAEFSPSLLYARLSGKTITESSSIQMGTNIGYSEDENRGFTFYENRFSLNFFYWF